ncbi:MAG TPA: TlpA disulfide reductase family protein [Chitinophagaceae bacterium]|jgi:thiol-disulfide isomerase/thioredoxin|nr:TlpA disulfide reductase family protein [Chitinophagaceae bacterium]
MKLFTCSVLLLLTITFINAQQKTPGTWWRAQLHREDGQSIVFNFEWTTEKGKPVWFIRNASERIRVTDIKTLKDSLIIQMPLYESQFRIKKEGNGLTGKWIKGGAVKTSVLGFTATKGSQRFDVVASETSQNIHGRWAASFATNNLPEQAIAEFSQHENNVTGTFLNPTGDYRYLEGVIVQDSLKLSCFDGGHAFLFTAKVDNNNAISNGWFYSGASFKQQWHAEKNDTATLPEDDVAMYLRAGEDKIHFKFNDLDNKPVSIDDERFKNKVVIVQLMGSWCPNCMDETAFLSEYYKKNKQRGIEIVSLAYEYSTDRERSLKTLRRCQQRFNVTYPMLITGVSVNDSLRTEKTLPELTQIKFFPSSVIIDKKGKVRKLDTGFNGPGTGEHYVLYKKEFEETVDKLLVE